MDISNKNIILQETVSHIEKLLGNRINSITIERATLGLFFTGIKLSDGHGGLCYTPVKEIPQAVCCPSSAEAMPLSGKLAGRSVREVLRDLFHDNVLRKTLAIATLNALSASCWNLVKEKNYQLEIGADAFDEVEIRPLRRTVVVGALAPLLKKLIKAQAEFHVIEMDPSTLKPYEMPYYIPSALAGEVVPEADILVITGVTLLNNTLPELIAMAKPGAQIIMAGPTASMLPDAFFSRGVSMLGGVLVTKPDDLLDVISEGGSGYHFFGKSAQRMIIRKENTRI